MKDKILNALKQEYAHLGLGDGILSGLAEMLAGTKLVTDENLQGIVAGQKAYLEDLQKSNDKRVQDAVTKTQNEANTKAEKERAANLRRETINGKAKEKGIPDWMIAHGFADITDDADDAKIDEILSRYANEIQTNLLPGRNSIPAFDGKQATKADTDSMVAKLFPSAQKK